MSRFSTAWAIFQGLLLEALPFLLIGIIIAGISRWLVPQASWIRRIPQQSFLAPFIGVMLGFFLPACECGNVPVARRLLANGAPLGTGFGFLFAAPVLNPIVIASTWAAFPDKPWLLLARPLGAFFIALSLSGILGLMPESKLLEPALLAERRLHLPLGKAGLLDRGSGILKTTSCYEDSRSFSERLKPSEILINSTNEFLNLLALLILGCALAAAIQTWLPRSWFLAVGSAPTLSVLALMLLALVVSVCSSVDAFLALSFSAQTTPGALLAFLLLGPVMDLKLAGLFTVLLRPKAIAITFLSALIFVLMVGQWVNLWLL